MIVVVVIVGLLTGASPHPPPDSVVLRRVPRGGIQPEAVRDSAGRIHLLYFSGEPSAGDLHYVRSSDDGATFTKPLRVNSEAGSAIATGTIRGGQLALGRGGRPHVAWNGSGKAGVTGPRDDTTGRAGAQMFYSRLNPEGTAFEPQRGLIQRTLNLDGGGAIAADTTGNVYVAWHGDDGRSAVRGEASRIVWLARSSNNGRTFHPEIPVWKQSTGTCGCCALELFADGRHVSVMYRAAGGGTERDVYFLASSDGARTFRGARIHPWKVNACPMTSMAFARSGSRLLGAWETEGKIFLSELDPRQPRAVRIVEPAASPAPMKHPRIAVSSKREVLVVWAEGTGWSRGGSAAWQVFDAKGQRTGVNGRAPGVPVWSFPAAVPGRDGRFVVFY